MKNLRKLCTVLWKDIRMRINHPIMTVVELVLPLVAVICLNALVPKSQTNPPVEFKHSFTNQSCQVTVAGSADRIIYSPSNDKIDELMKKVACYAGYKRYHVTPGNLSKSVSDKTAFKVKFLSLPDDISQESLKYIIYPPTMFLSSNKLWNFEDYTLDKIEKESYMKLQHAIDVSYIEILHGGKFDYSGINVRSIVKATVDIVLLTLLATLSIITGLLFLAPVITSRIVNEKFCGAKELMLMMGLKKWHIWLAKFIDSCMAFLLVLSLITLFLFVPLTSTSIVFEVISVWKFWLFLMASGVAMILFMFFLSCLFQRPNVATVASQFLIIGTYVLFSTLDSNQLLTKLTRLLFALFPHILLLEGVTLFAAAENLGKNVGFTERLSGNSSDVYLLELYAVAIVDSVLYVILTWYLDSIMPGKYGMPQPFCFFLKKSYWCTTDVQEADVETVLEGGPGFERPTGNLVKGITIRNLRKTYRSWRRGVTVAVDNVNLDIYHGEITALLGHNGAGKTTTMSIITGIVPATSGEVKVNGYSTRTELTKVRESLGLCPQENMLFDDLTAYQNLLFYAKIKGMSSKEAKVEIRSLFTKMKMVGSGSRAAKNLSGGQKRKLSLAIAIIGGSKVLILDEPTSGMDPEIRREIWEILTAMRGQRTILITTHIMEEADAISDRIAIMDHGQVKCFGTQIFLKNKYGLGYKLSVVILSPKDADSVKEKVISFLPAEYMGKDATTLSFRLNEELRPKFPKLFDGLEKEKQSNKIVSYSLAITTLEDVFLRIREISDEARQDQVDHSSPYRRFYSTDQLNEKKKHTGLVLILLQLCALLTKKCLSLLQSLFSFLIFLGVVIILTLMPYFLSSYLHEPHAKSFRDGRVEYSLAMYPGTEIFYHGTSPQTDKFRSLVEQGSDLTEHYVDNILQALADIFKEDVYRYERGVLLAVDTITNTLYYNIHASYSPLIALNLHTNSLLKNLQRDNSRVGREIVTYIDNTLAADEEVVYYVREDPDKCPDNLSIFPQLLAIQSFFFLTGVMHERAHGSKQLQLLLVTPTLYWLSHLIFDCLVFLLPLILMTVILVYVYEDPFITESMGEITLGCVLCMIGLLILVYLISCFVSGVILAYIIAVMLYFVFVYIISVIQGFLSEWVIYLYPATILTNGLNQFSCDNTNTKDKNYLIYLTIYDIIGVFILILKESYVVSYVVKKLLNKANGVKFPRLLNKEEDVRREEDYVKKVLDDNQVNKEALLVDDLHAWYGLIHSRTVVKGISFSVHHGECFCLLGVNGAGKSSTFKMLTGELVPSSGDAHIGDSSLSKLPYQRKYIRRIGYCPQTSGLLPGFTGRQLLVLFARLRGIKETIIKDEVEQWLTVMQLREYSDKKCGYYSGGNQRKLNTAIALIGDSPVVFLDEPSSGVDPMSRRKIWNVLTNIKKEGQCIVLTSHSMDECEALCSRLAIMVQGQFVCMGELVTVKNKFGRGYSVQIMLASTATNDDLTLIKNKIFKLFGADAQLTDEHLTLLQYHISSAGISWSVLFNGLENLKSTVDVIVTYTASETTLEEIFIHFAKKQVDVTPPPQAPPPGAPYPRAPPPGPARRNVPELV